MKLKLNADISREKMKIIDRAVELEQRTRSNFIRLACLKEARRIIKENKTEG